MSMYMYEGYGLVLPVSACDSERAVVEAANEYLGGGFQDIEDLDSSGVLGDYESVDNIEYAQVNGYEVDTSLGVFIYRFADNDDPLYDLEQLVLALGFEDGLDDEEIVGNFQVECLS